MRCQFELANLMQFISSSCDCQMLTATDSDWVWVWVGTGLDWEWSGVFGDGSADCACGQGQFEGISHLQLLLCNQFESSVRARTDFSSANQDCGECVYCDYASYPQGEGGR